MKIIELFSGIGSQAQALKNIDINFTSTCCEVDGKIHSIYEAIHGSTPNLGDIKKVQSLPSCDLLTYSFPCQDISILGDQKGLDKGSNTRSGLLWEVERLLLEYKKNGNLPEFLLLENVKNLVNPKHRPNFDKWLAFLSEIGYYNSWFLLNSEDYGVPQNRNRVFVLSCLSKSINYSHIPISVAKLSEYFSSDEEVIYEFGDCHFFKNPRMRSKIITTINNTQSTNSTNRIYGQNSITHAITTQGSHPGNFGAILYSSKIETEVQIRKKLKGLSDDNIICADIGFDINSIRLATPKDVFKLMGFGEEEYLKVKTHLFQNRINQNFFYHIAGNSIVVPVLEDIFKSFLKG